MFTNMDKADILLNTGKLCQDLVERNIFQRETVTFMVFSLCSKTKEVKFIIC